MRAVVVAGLVLAASASAWAQPPPGKSKYPPVKPAPELPPPEPEEPKPAVPKPPSPRPTPSPAPAPEASEPSNVMTDNTRPAWAALGFGPSIGIVGCVRRLCNLEQSYTQFKLSEDFGYHVSGSDGFAVGANLQQAFGNDVFRGTAAFKMWWDAPLSDELTLYLTPMVSAGYALLHFDFGELGSITDHAFEAQAGLGVRMVFSDAAIIYVRPVTADVLIGEDGVSLFYDIAVGGGFTFDP